VAESKQAKKPKVAAATPRGPGPRRGQGKERILEAALELFSSYGFDAVSTTDIAQKAGSSQSVVLYHFGTKEGLWQCAMRALFAKVGVSPRFDSPMYKDLDAVSRLRVLLRSFVLTSARHPELGRVINREGLSDSDRLTWLVDELARPNYAVFEALFAEGVAQGFLKAYPPQMLTLFVHGAAATIFNLAAIARRQMDADPLSPEMIEMQADMVIEVLLNGLLVRPSSAR
jgi:TetR/AcrR family transcriptional regulator